MSHPRPLVCALGLALAGLLPAHAQESTEVEQPTQVAVLETPPFSTGAQIADLVWMPDDGLGASRLVAATRGGGVIVWDDVSGRRVAVLDRGAFCTRLAVVSGGLLVASPPSLTLWNVAQRRPRTIVAFPPSELRFFSSHGPPPPEMDLAVSPDGTQVAVCWMNEVRVYSCQDLSLVQELRIPPRPADEAWAEPPELMDYARFPHTLRWTADGRRVEGRGSARWGSGGYSWQVGGPALPTSLPPLRAYPSDRGENEWAADVVPLADGAAELRGVRDPKGDYRRDLVRLTPNGEVTWRTPLGVGHGFECLARRDDVLFVAGPEGALRRFDLDDGQEVRLPQPTPGPIRRVFSGLGDALAWDTQDRLWRWGPAAARPLCVELPTPLGSSRALALDVTPTLTHAAAHCEDGTVVVWELASGEVLERWDDGDQTNHYGGQAAHGLAVRGRPQHPPLVVYYAQSPGNVDGDGTFSSGAQLLARRGGERLIERAVDAGGGGFALDTTGRRLVARGEVRDLIRDELHGRLGHDRRFVSAFGFSHDGSHVALAGLRNGRQRVFVYETAALDPERLLGPNLQLALGTGSVSALAFSPHDDTLAVVQAHAITLIPVDGNALARRIEVEHATSAAFVSSRRLAVGHRDGQLTLWKVGE